MVDVSFELTPNDLCSGGDAVCYDAASSSVSICSSVPPPLSSVPATGFLLPRSDSPGIDSPPPKAATADHDPVDAEIYFEASGDDAPEEPASPPADPTPTGSAEEKEDAPEDNPDVQPASPVPSFYCAAITPTQWAALPADLRCDTIRKASLTVLHAHKLDEEALVLQRRLEIRRHMRRSGPVCAYAVGVGHADRFRGHQGQALTAAGCGGEGAGATRFDHGDLQPLGVVVEGVCTNSFPTAAISVKSLALVSSNAASFPRLLLRRRVHARIASCDASFSRDAFGVRSPPCPMYRLFAPLAVP